MDEAALAGNRAVGIDYNGERFGIIDCAVGASFAVLLVEELFVSGCRLLVSMTSAGQILAKGPTPYFVLIDRALGDEGTSVEIVVADSGSADRTVELAAAGRARVVVEQQRGYGRACLAGARAAAGNCAIIVFLDGDGSDCPELIPVIVEPIIAGTHDFVVGSRTRGEREPGSMSAHQILAGHIAGAAMRLLYGASLSNARCRTEPQDRGARRHDAKPIIARMRLPAGGHGLIIGYLDLARRGPRCRVYRRTCRPICSCACCGRC